MAANKRSERGRNHPSDTIYQYPAGTIAHKARYGADIISKVPNEDGDLPNKPDGTVRS